MKRVERGERRDGEGGERVSAGGGGGWGRDGGEEEEEERSGGEGRGGGDDRREAGFGAECSLDQHARNGDLTTKPREPVLTRAWPAYVGGSY